MKKLVSLLVAVIIFLSCVTGYALTRNEIYRMFGPKILEAVVLVIKDEINILRTQHALPERTNQQLLNALETKMGIIADYDWMD